MSDGFQPDAFQTDAFQTDVTASAVPVSLGGIMTILLLAQRTGRRERSIVYGPKHPSRRR